jgi:hypothetical protein
MNQLMDVDMILTKNPNKFNKCLTLPLHGGVKFKKKGVGKRCVRVLRPPESRQD